jgi:hypothetical protein
MTVAPELDLGSLFGTAADGNAAVLTVGAVLAVAAARFVALVVIAVLKAAALVAVVGTVLWVGYEAVQNLDASVPASLTVPADRPAELPTMGPLAPR